MYLIEGINPLVISKIISVKGFRYGEHPLAIRQFKNKHPIKYFFGLGPRPGMFDFYSHPSVKIFVGDKLVKCIICVSNDEAKTLAEKLNKKLENYLNLIANLRLYPK